MATLKKKWDWSLILAGILLLACGLLCCFAPNLTLATIAMIAGVGFLLSGVLGIVFYVRLQVYDERVGMVIGLRDPRRADRPDVRAASAGGRRGHLVAGGPVLPRVRPVRDIRGDEIEKHRLLSMGVGLFSGIVNIVCAIMLFVSPILFSLLVAVFVLWRGVAMIAEGVTVGKIVYR